MAISNRLPVNKTPSGWRVSAGGLVTALRPLMERGDGAWVGWDGGADETPAEIEGLATTLEPVTLTRAEVQAYYHGFSNRTIWPLFHDLVGAPVFDRSWWVAYQKVNEKFADVVEKAADAHKCDRLWVQDYHLMLLPQLLRERSLKTPISFFLHTPFPPPELFARLPWREEIIRGLLGADVVSFHTDRYRKNFVRTCGRSLRDIKVKLQTKEIEMPDGRIVRTQANPISIDVDEFADGAVSDDAEKEFRRLRRQFGDRKVLVGVDRLDYTKGILERLQAFERLLEDRKDLRTEAVLVQIAIPSRGAVNEYKQLRIDIEQAIGRINGRFTEPGSHVPVYYLHRGVPRAKLLAYYRLADVFLVTALKDGMNLVSKEFVIAQDAAGSSGALVLSEFAGASLELTQAILCNPFDIEGLAIRIGEALDMDPRVRRRRLKQMADTIRKHDIHAWATEEMPVKGKSR